MTEDQFVVLFNTHQPIVSVNAAVYWYALRQHGIHDRISGFGKLLEKTDIDAGDTYF